MRPAHVGILRFCQGPVCLLAWLACPGPALAQGRAARFLGVERWQATSATHVAVQIQGRSKDRTDTYKFRFERHQIQGTKESWEWTLKVKASDKDRNELMEGTVSEESTSDFRLELDTGSDEAVLQVHMRPTKAKVRAGVFDRTAMSLSMDQPDQDFEWRAPIADDSTSLVFHKEARDDLVVGSIDSVWTLTLEPDD